MLNFRGLPHIIYLVLIFTLVVEFVSGIKKLYIFGAIYLISLIFFGVLLSEFDSVKIGAVSVIAFFLASI